MFVMTGKNSALANQVIEFMAKIYPNLTEVDIEVIPTDLTVSTGLYTLLFDDSMGSLGQKVAGYLAVSYTHLTLPTTSPV